MKYKKILMAAMTFVALTLTSAQASAKDIRTPKMYMFGFAASFSDSIVHFTDIHEIDSVWIDSKSKFLIGRDDYSYQLRDYLTRQSLPHRTCIILYNANKAKLEKQYQKMRKLYGPAKDGKLYYEIRNLKPTDFRFHVIDYAVDEESAAAGKKKKK